MIDSAARADTHGSLCTECFICQLAAGCGPAYDAYHGDVWPEVQEQLRASGTIDYRSILVMNW